MDWWATSGLELKYTYKAMEYAVNYLRIDMLLWWKNSGLKVKYSEWVLTEIEHDKAFRRIVSKHPTLLEWLEHLPLLP